MSDAWFDRLRTLTSKRQPTDTVNYTPVNNNAFSVLMKVKVINRETLWHPEVLKIFATLKKLL